MINLEKEIREQPSVYSGFVSENIEMVRTIVADIKASGITNVQFAARGTSDHACIYAQYLFHTIVGVPCGLATPSAVSKYKGNLAFAKTLVFGVSQSGKAADVISVIERANATGAITVALTNNPESPLAKTAKYHLYCNAGAETSIAATKTFTTQMMALALFAAVWADDGRLLANLSNITGQHRYATDQLRIHFLRKKISVKIVGMQDR
jgi:glucosamine--fructose-6-phosphate aminotransferase (isomerizing)